VFFDNVSVVYLRRVPENAAIIERQEYRSLRRGLPPNFGAEMQGIPDATRAAHEAELDRCLSENPRCVYCMVGKAAFHRRRGHDDVAVEMLQAALVINPAAAEALVVLSSIYEGMGRTAEAAQTKRRFEKLTSPAAL
jgi:lipopolysaccharide biosynthesis regulator YciM